MTFYVAKREGYVPALWDTVIVGVSDGREEFALVRQLSAPDPKDCQIIDVVCSKDPALDGWYYVSKLTLVCRDSPF